MLDFVRRHSRSWGIKVLLIALIIVFIGWGGYLYQTRHASDVAMVGNHYITMSQYRTEYENMVSAIRKRFGGKVPQNLLKALDVKKRALDALVRHYLVVLGAAQLGLQATPGEVRAAILRIPAFRVDGKFNLRRYKTVLYQNRLTPEDFEKNMAREITLEKTEAFITSRAVVTKDEVRSYYTFHNERIKLAYMIFDPVSLEGRVKVEDAALKAFYKKNEKRYLEPEKREIAYVVVNTKDQEKEINPGERRIKQYYSDNAAEFVHQKQVRARRILLRIDPGASRAELKKTEAEAAKILREARKGKDFAALAKKYSQDEATAKNGGELGFFSYKQKDPAFAKAAFALKPGGISGIVRTPSGLNIIQVEQVKKAGIVPLEQVREKVINEIKSRGAGNLAYQKAQNLSDLAYAKSSIAKAALELKMKLAAPVWMTLSEDKAKAGLMTAAIRKKLFGLGEGDVSEMITIPGGYMVAQVKSIKTPEPAPFEQVKDKVAADFRMAEARKLAFKQASAMLKKAVAEKSLASAAETDKIDFMQSRYFSRQEAGQFMPLLNSASLESVFSLRQSKPFPKRPLEMGTNYMVCQLMGTKAAGAPSKEQEAQIYDTILQQKRAAIWSSWLGEIAKSTTIKYLRKI